MSSEQVNNDGTKEVLPSPESMPLEADIPGFEFELEENMSQLSAADSVRSSRMPNFEDNRHPHVKLFVVLFALSGCFYLIYLSCRDLPRQSRSVFCTFIVLSNECPMDSENDRQTASDFVEFFFRLSLELLYPIAVILIFITTHASITLVPGLAFRIRNPIPFMIKFINLVMSFHCITNFLTSISMLPFLSITTSWLYWQEYLTVSGLGLFWMYQLLNMNAFSRLTVFNFIRARENYETRQNAALGDMNF
ncbi:unnamed protein product [Caenorhabditis brenneri]